MIPGNLTDRINRLAIADKYYLYLRLKEEVETLPQPALADICREGADARAKKYAQIIYDLLGVDIFSNSREFPVPHCRMVVAAQLVGDGYTTMDAGKALGRDHSTIIYYLNTIESIINTPAFDPRVYSIWSNFQNAIHNETTDTSTIGQPAAI